MAHSSAGSCPAPTLGVGSTVGGWIATLVTKEVIICRIVDKETSCMNRHAHSAILKRKAEKRSRRTRSANSKESQEFMWENPPGASMKEQQNTSGMLREIRKTPI